ncbi:MAG: universal stress protein [Opitutales bacterium]
MYRFRKVLAHLGLRDGDEDAAIVQYASKVSHLAQSQRVEFIHVAAKVDVPTELKQRYPWLMEPIDEAARQRMEQTVQAHYNGYEGAKMSVEVVDGIPSQLVLERAKTDDIDLIVAGHSEDDGLLGTKLARKATCSVLTVPAKANPEFERVLVPLDFSKYSNNAIDVAAAFGQAQGLQALHGLHVYSVPVGAHRAAMNKEDFARDLKAHCERTFNDFLKKANCHGLQVESLLVESPLVPQAILSAARQNKADLIVLGCRGKDSFTAALLGSNTEAILREATIPVVAVKEKGTGRALLQTLLGA